MIKGYKASLRYYSRALPNPEYTYSKVKEVKGHQSNLTQQRYPINTLIKLSKVKNEENVLKAAREKKQIIEDYFRVRSRNLIV
jgi:hypothetical protein